MDLCKLEPHSQPAHVTGTLLPIGDQVRSWLDDILGDAGEISLEGGPYGYIDHNQPQIYPGRGFSLFGCTGSIPPHSDGAGQTLGFVLHMTGRHHLIVDDQSFELQEGCVYHIDSDRDHATICDNPDGLLMFVTIDFGWHQKSLPAVTYEEYARHVVDGIDRQITELAASQSSPTADLIGKLMRQEGIGHAA